MRILTILGSPRREGNTAKVLRWIEGQLQGDGHVLDRVDIVDYSICGCGECKACKRGQVELCRIEDDANGLFRRMAEADLVLFAAPVFCWGFPAQLKGLIDRMYGLMDFEGERQNVPRLYRKPVALLLTAGGEEKDNADLVIRGFENLVELIRGRFAGHLLVPGCSDPKAIGEDVMTRATEFAGVLTRCTQGEQ
jgi:multimeric flavodoxin WrbA